MKYGYLSISLKISCAETVQQEDKEKFRSGLKWISVKDVKMNPSKDKLWYSGLIPKRIIGLILNIWGKIFLDSTLVHPGIGGTILDYYGHNEHRSAICKAKVHGCVYPGEAWYDFNNSNEDGNPWCHIITETGAENITETVMMNV